MALTREMLDELVCDCNRDDCDNSELYFHSRCHPNSPTWVAYSKGVATVKCAECGEETVAISVK